MEVRSDGMEDLTLKLFSLQYQRKAGRQMGGRVDMSGEVVDQPATGGRYSRTSKAGSLVIIPLQL